MKPRVIPRPWCKTCATGDRQFVVQEALDTIRSSAVNVLSFTPYTIVLSAFLPGAEIKTRLDPFSRCGRHASLDVKTPVHSKTTSTWFQGRSAGLRRLVTSIGPRPASGVVSVVVTVPATVSETAEVSDSCLSERGNRESALARALVSPFLKFRSFQAFTMMIGTTQGAIA